MKSSITRSEYLQLLGLMELSRQLNQQINNIVIAGNTILGETDGDPTSTWFADESYSRSPDVDSMLRKHHVTVEEPPAPTEVVS